MLQSEMEGQSFPPNVFQAKVTLFASVLHKFFLEVSISVISVALGLIIAVYLGALEWVYRWLEAGRSLIQKKKKKAL